MGGKMTWMHRIALSLLCCLAASTFATAAPDDTLLDRLVALETRCDTLCSPADGKADLRAQIEVIAERLRTALNAAGKPSGAAAGTSSAAGATSSAPAASAHDTAAARVEALNRFLFDGLGLRASPDLKDPDNLFLSRVLARKQGYCVGIASLYLVLAERLGLPIRAVATPAHVFLRYDDGVARLNIETLQRGAAIPDDRYVREQRIPPRAIRKGIFLRDLTADEFMAQVLNNLGVIYSERKEYAEAEAQYEDALHLDPRQAAAWYNSGNDLLARAAYRRAARCFTKALRLWPADVWALNNRGVTFLKMSRPGKARRDFEAALALDPGFEAARKNLRALEEGSSP